MSYRGTMQHLAGELLELRIRLIGAMRSWRAQCCPRVLYHRLLFQKPRITHCLGNRAHPARRTCSEAEDQQIVRRNLVRF